MGRQVRGERKAREGWGSQAEKEWISGKHAEKNCFIQAQLRLDLQVESKLLFNSTKII